MKNIIFTLLILIAVTGCQLSNKDSASNNEIEKIALDKYKEHIHYLSNKNKSYTICYQQQPETSNIPYPALKFFVFDENTQQIIFEDNLANGSLKWIGLYKLEVQSTPGIVSVKADTSTKYVYDVKLRKKI